MISHGHTLVMFELDEDLLYSIVSRLDFGIKSLNILMKVLINRFPNYNENESFYFKVGTVIIRVDLNFGGWICKVYSNTKSTYSYLMVCEKMCKQLCQSTGHGLELNINEGMFKDISTAFSNIS